MHYRIIMDKKYSPSFSFDDVCVPPDIQIGAHSQTSWELSVVIVGSGTRTIGGLTEPIVEKEAVLVPPGIRHQWQFDGKKTDIHGNIRNMSVMVGTGILQGTAELFCEFKENVSSILAINHAVAYSHRTSTEINRIMHRMCSLSDIGRIPLFLQLLVAMSDTEGSRDAGRYETVSNVEKKINRIEVFCKCNFARQISLDDLASHIGTNKSALCTFLRRHKGMSFTEYLNSLRLHCAAEMLLSTTHDIAEIAYDSGFISVPYFNKLFRRYYGTTPREYRATNQSVRVIFPCRKA